MTKIYLEKQAIQFIKNSILKMFIVLWFKLIETTML